LENYRKASSKKGKRMKRIDESLGESLGKSKSEWQGPKLPAPGDQPGQDGARVRWLQKIAAKERIAQARQRLQPMNASGRRVDSEGAAQSLAGLIHDARNMVSAMDLYCDLLEESGVLAAPFRHYAGELRLVSGAGRRLLEKMAIAESTTERRFAKRLQSAPTPLPGLHTDSQVSVLPQEQPWNGSQQIGSPDRWDVKMMASAGEASGRSADEEFDGATRRLPVGLIRDGRRKVFHCSEPVANLAEELSANQNLLSALVGPGVTVGLSISGGRRPVGMTGDDLTRVLVNLARNAAEAMRGAGHLQIDLEEGAEYLSLTFTDDGPGIPESALETIFSPGYSTRVGRSPVSDSRSDSNSSAHAWPVQHRGLGLSIVRSLVASAGGSAWAANRRPYLSSAASTSASRHPEAHESGEVGRIAQQDNLPIQGAVIVIEFPLLDLRALDPQIAT
jgi:Histidine kinase-, DNA gyrase B-, and HSP90-like ATPase